MKENNSNWTSIPDRLYRILIIGWSGSERNVLLNLINHQPEIDKIQFIHYTKNPYEVQLLILIKPYDPIVN